MAINLAHKSITIDVNDRNAPNVVGIVNVNDKATRFLDVTLTASGEKLTFTGCTATATFVTDGYLISDAVVCTLNSTADVITVPLENFNSTSGFLAIEIKIANGETQVLNTPLTLKVMVTPSLAENSKINNESIGSFADISREVATARGDSADLNTRFTADEASLETVKSEITTARGSSSSLGIRLNGIDSSVSNKADKSTVSQLSARMQTAEKALTGKEDNSNKVSSKTDITDSSTNYPSVKYLDDYYYGANETYSSEETDKLLGNKADKATTLAGYGITDAYTKEDVQKKLNKKLDSMPFDSEPKNNSPCYLTSGTVYKALLAKTDVNSVYSKTETDNSLGEKADKADVDTALMNKANLVNSSNIFDFDAWAKELQKSSKPIIHGTLDELNFDEKSITFTATEKDTYTNSWQVFLAGTTKISVKPNTKYWVYYTVNNYVCNLVVFLNGNHTDGALVSIKNGKGTFVTNNDTSFITIRFGTYNSRGAFKVSNIMIAEKESIYLPNKVAEGVPEVANEALAFEKTTQASLDSKYDSANIESGTSTLTPHSNVTNKIKSAKCTYKTIGDVVIVSATVKMNATTIGANSTYPLINLPYKCISVDDVFCVGISNLGKLFKFAVVKNNTWLQFQSQDKTDYTFADGEQINATCLYKIK